MISTLSTTSFPPGNHSPKVHGGNRVAALLEQFPRGISEQTIRELIAPDVGVLCPREDVAMSCENYDAFIANWGKEAFQYLTPEQSRTMRSSLLWTLQFCEISIERQKAPRDTAILELIGYYEPLFKNKILQETDKIFGLSFKEQVTGILTRGTSIRSRIDAQSILSVLNEWGFVL